MISGISLHQLDSWQRYQKGMCDHCMAHCCRLPVEVRFADLLRMELVTEFEAGESLKALAKRLMLQGIVAHFNYRTGIFTLVQYSSGDCLYLDRHTRRCTIYHQRPDTCRQHPQQGPRPGFCAYQPRAPSRPG